MGSEMCIRDSRNIINQFRELRQNISPDKRLQMVISGGRISQSVMSQVSQATSSEAIVDALRRSNAFDDVGLMRQSRSLKQ